MASTEAVRSVRESRGVRLRAATALLESVLDTLDTDSDVCPCCGITKKENWPEHGAAQMLTGMIQKCQRLEASGICDPDADLRPNYPKKEESHGDEDSTQDDKRA